MITMAKGLTNGAVPMGAVAASDQIYDAFMQGPEGAIELFHGYTYSAHPVACAAGIATQEIYRKEGLFTRANEMAGYWADGVHSLRGLPHVIDLRNLGLIGAVELDPLPGKPGLRLQRLRAGVRAGTAAARDGRHHRDVTAADHREAAHRPYLGSSVTC
jgi:beta-alanine--pyruvate transaminase